MFERKGYVKVALDKGERFEIRMERLLDAALEATADDFEELNSTNDVTEIEVRFSAITSVFHGVYNIL